LDNVEEIDERFDKKISLKNGHDEKADIIVNIEEEKDNLFAVAV